MIKTLYLRTLFWLAVGAWLLMLRVDGQSVDRALLSPASLVMLFLIVATTSFEKWLWKIPQLYSWFVSRPNISGTYKGLIVSRWVNPETGQSPDPILSYLCIWQTLSWISIRVYTAESASVSLVGSFVEHPDGHQQLVYTYRNEPQIGLRERSAIHYGGAQLRVSNGTFRLDGSYWTDRQTVGSMDFQRVSRASCLSFEECEGIMDRPEVTTVRRLWVRIRGRN